jgi:hypothetical protein
MTLIFSVRTWIPNLSSQYMESRGILIILLKIHIPRLLIKPTWNPYYFTKNQVSTFTGFD